MPRLSRYYGADATSGTADPTQHLAQKGGCAIIPDYPRGKLDIKLVVERDDASTRTALESLDLPARYEIVVAPPGLPATKPRALNVALPAARGALVAASVWQITGDLAIYLLAVSGLMTMAIPGLTAMRRRRIAVRPGILATLPLYYALICVATWAALFDLAIRPYHWAKTEHGLSRAWRTRPAALPIVQGAKRGRPISI